MNKMLFVFCLTLAIVGCSSTPERNAAPADLAATKGLLSDPSIRIWGDVPFSNQAIITSELQRKETFDISLVVDEDGKPKPQHHLTISGGGANGAYGAGILNGLSQTGERPEYRLVTGISTGAIIGLYAFLGEEYDHKLKEFYTELSDDDLYDTRYIWQLFSSSSLLNTEAFAARVRNEIDRELLSKVKHEYLRGRTFLVKTTNLDSQRPVIWNMGAIAMHDSDEAEHLFESVIIASASIPGIFEPVSIPVFDGEKQYDELHVDGGVVSQVFFIPEGVDVDQFSSLERNYLSQQGLEDLGEASSHVWLINNSRTAATWVATDPTVMSIMGRSIATMIKFQGRSNLSQIYEQSQATGSTFNLSYIHNAVPDAPSDAPFSRDYMRRIYCYGVTQGMSQNHWSHGLPDYDKLQNISSNQESVTEIADFDWDQLESGLSQQVNACLADLDSVDR